jgi:hypothetical protein
MELPIPLKFVTQTAFWALLIAREDKLKISAARTRIIVIVTKISTKVNPREFLGFMGFLILRNLSSGKSRSTGTSNPFRIRKIPGKSREAEGLYFSF